MVSTNPPNNGGFTEESNNVGPLGRYQPPSVSFIDQTLITVFFFQAVGAAAVIVVTIVLLLPLFQAHFRAFVVVRTRRRRRH